MSNLETRANLVDNFCSRLFFLKVVQTMILVVSIKCETLLTLDELHMKRNNGLSSLREGSSHNNTWQACKEEHLQKVNVGSVNI